MNEKEIIQQYLDKTLPIIKFHKMCTYIGGPVVVLLLLLVKTDVEWVSKAIIGLALVYLMFVKGLSSHIAHSLLLCPVCGKHLSGSAFKNTIKDVPKECPHCKVVLR